VILGLCDQSGRYRVVLDVRPDSVELSRISNPVIVRLSLPERFALAVQHLVGLPRRKSFQRLQQPAGIDQRQNQQMYVVGHDDVGVQFVIPQLPRCVMDGILYQASKRLLAKPNRARSGRIQ
jgi:hypothetical protein